MNNTNTNYKSNNPIKENRKIEGTYTMNVPIYSNNAKAKVNPEKVVIPISFKPNKKEKEFLEMQDNKSDSIHKALEMLMSIRENPNNLLSELSLKYPINWRKINRRNGQKINQKLKELKCQNN